MFTGLVEEVGILKERRSQGDGYRLVIEAHLILEDIHIGDSIATNGICLTVTNVGEGWFSADILEITAEVTGLGELPIGAKVNLERAMAMKDRFGGHIVSGHIDGLGKILSKGEEFPYITYEVSVPAEFHKYMVKKGSIALNGISLTIQELTKEGFRISIIPETIAQTNLKNANPGDVVCLEFDMIAKFVERLMKHHEEGISISRLKEWGY